MKRSEYESFQVLITELDKAAESPGNGEFYSGRQLAYESASYRIQELLDTMIIEEDEEE